MWQYYFPDLVAISGKGAEILGLDLLVRRKAIAAWKVKQRWLFAISLVYVAALLAAVFRHNGQLSTGAWWLFVIIGLSIAEGNDKLAKQIARLPFDPNPIP